MLDLGLGRRDSVVRGQINNKEDVRIWTSRASYDFERWGKYAKEEYLLSKRSGGQKVYSIVQGDVPGSSINEDMLCEHTGQMGAEKYLKESYHHRIECSVANSLAALMRNWCLNSAFQPNSYPQRLQEDADGTRINTSNLMSTWRVEMRGGKQYKIGGRL